MNAIVLNIHKKMQSFIRRYTVKMNKDSTTPLKDTYCNSLSMIIKNEIFFLLVNVLFARRDVPNSPFNVLVEGFAGDAAKVTAAGPGN